MRMALSFAMRGAASVSPNPKVGCVIVDESVSGGRLTAWGYHRIYGGPHAEVEALRKAGGRAAGCTVYVNLEPCCHEGKTPPCSEALIKAGVSRVVIGAEDPNPKVSGGGAASLRGAGIDVSVGVLEEECRWLNRGFIRAMTMGRPWVTVKAAISIDGEMALQNGESRWISGSESRKRAHLMRAENDAVLVGVGTILKDDPELTVRNADGRSPMKIIMDRDLDTPPDAKVLDEGKCMFFTSPSSDEGRAGELSRRGAAIMRQEGPMERRLSIDELLGRLVPYGINNLMVEGGAKLIGSFISSRLVDEFSLFVAPRLLGQGLDLLGGMTFKHMEEAVSMKRLRIRRTGDDIWFEGIPSCSPAL
jgi:diaminohydroxyphosphoribosylaminopyrimidine deaminase/5-amino-6-(5-phosphoribosylamino)uracil reductase